MTLLRRAGRAAEWIIGGAFSAYINFLALTLTRDRSNVGPLH